MIFICKHSLKLRLLSNISLNAASKTDLQQLTMVSLGQSRGYLRSVDIYSRQNVPGAIPDLRPSLDTNQPTSLITG